ncbi:MAG: site-specific DNA-methyltransferase [Bacteroidota bacterium]|jgi:site-specific DNA-methyltransferase (cytosine-N4-specific)
MTPEVLTLPLGDNPSKATLYYGQDVRASLKIIPDQSIQTALTSPPYWNLRDYHCEGQIGLEKTPEDYIQELVSVFREMKRVLRDDGTFWLNLGDSYAGSWGNQGRKEERGTQRAINGPIIQNLQPYPDAGSHTGSWVKDHPTLKPKDLVGIPWRVAFALQEDGWWLRNAIVWHKMNAMPCSVEDRFSCKYELIFLFSKQAQYFFDLDAVRVPHTYGQYDLEGAFAPAQNWSEKNEGDRKMDHTEQQFGNLAGSPRRVGRGLFNPLGKNPGDVWCFPTAQYKGSHFAVFPPDLVEPMIKAGSSAQGCCPKCGTPWRDRKQSCSCDPQNPIPCTVLDPFSGSGTTGLVSLKLGRDYIGIDLNSDFLPLARARILEMAAPDADSPEEESILSLL